MQPGRIPRRRRANAHLIAAWGLLFLGFLGVSLRRYMARDADTVRRPRHIHLGEEDSAVARARRARSEREKANSERVKKARGRRIFSHAGARTFFAAPGEDSDALNADMRDLLTSKDVLLRLFGTPHGDFLYHRTRGWMRFEDGRWMRIESDELPLEIQGEYPEFMGPQPTAGGDAAFTPEPWMDPEDEDGEEAE